MIKLLITGGKGQVASCLKPLLSDFEFLCPSHQELDIQQAEMLKSFIHQHGIDMIINTAAMTNVDGAETSRDLAFAVNAHAVQTLADTGLPMIHLSTDYVFDGEKNTPYTEDDACRPLSIYGQSKRAGEEFLHDRPKTMVIRTSTVYAAGFNNFVTTMAKLCREKSSLDVVIDQVSSPTYAPDLAQAIKQAIPVVYEGLSGFFHMTNLGLSSRYDLAVMIRNYLGATCSVRPIFTAEMPRPAPRPAYSVLSCDKITKALNLNIPHYSESLMTCLKNL